MGEEIEIEFNDVSRGIKLRLKGPQKIVDEYIEKFGGFSSLKLPSTQEVQVNQQVEKKATTQNNFFEEELPEKPSNAETLTQYLEAIMKSPWGLKGRTSQELMQLSKVHAIAISPTTLSGILNRLMKDGKVRRTKKPGDAFWSYYPPMAYSLKSNK